MNHSNNTLKNVRGFTLIELLVAIMIFAVISVISYKTIASLVTTQKVVNNAQAKWGSLSKTISIMSSSWDRAIPLAVRDENGILLPAVYGKNKLSGNFDSQVEFTLNGFVGDPQYGASPPKRLGFRFLNGQLYLVSWPVLNRIQSTEPRVDLLLDNIDTFTVEFLYPDKQWRDTWPLDNSNFTNLPPGFRVYIKLKSGEEISRVWAL